MSLFILLHCTPSVPIGRFPFSRCIIFTMYVDIVYIRCKEEAMYESQNDL